MKFFSRQTLNTFIIGICVGITAILTYMLLSGNLPWLKAAGVGTGAPDVNARYLDGYGTVITTSAASKILATDGSGYLPDNSVDTGAIVDGTIVAGDIATDTITATQIAAGAVGTSEIADNSVSITADLNLATDGAGSGLDADLLDGADSTSYVWPGDISCGTGFTDMGTYCIQTAEAAAGATKTWYAASDYCHDTYGGARLCTSSEWYNACVNGNLTNDTDGYEWVDSWGLSTDALRRGGGSCTTVDYGSDSNASGDSNAFRCCK